MDKLKDILNYYKETWQVNDDIETVYQELINNNVEVHKDSYFCPIWNKENNVYLLMAGTKNKADIWVLKKIIKLIKEGKPILSLLNGNSEELLKQLHKYNVKILDKNDQIVTIGFNLEGTQWQ